MAIVAAKQERSRQTFTSLLDAAEELLMERTFEEINVHEIVARAGASIGSFYARFSDKEALRECLIDRYNDDLVRVASDILVPGDWEGQPLAVRADAFIRKVVETCRRRRGLMRMRVLHITAQGGLAKEHLVKTREFVRRVEAFLKPCLHEVRHPDPETGLPFALRLIDTMVAATILFDGGEGDSFRDIDDEILITETTRAFLSYLGACEDDDQRRGPR